MMTYEAWRITFQSSEQAARAAYRCLARIANIEVHNANIISWSGGLEVPRRRVVLLSDLNEATKPSTTNPSETSGCLVDELATLEREIATESAISTIETECVRQDDGWYNTETYDIYDPVQELRYLELRGLLDRHPDNPSLVKIRSE